MNYLCFDFGMSSWGCAIGDDATLVVTPIAALKASRGVPNWVEISTLIDCWDIGAFVIGYPLKASGERFKLTDKVDIAINNLKRFNLKINLSDERLTTVLARENIFSEKGYRGLEKGAIDSESAKLILQNWFSDAKSS